MIAITVAVLKKERENITLGIKTSCTAEISKCRSTLQEVKTRKIGWKHERQTKREENRILSVY